MNILRKAGADEEDQSSPDTIFDSDKYESDESEESDVMGPKDRYYVPGSFARSGWHSIEKCT